MINSFETPQTQDKFERLSESHQLEIAKELLGLNKSNLSKDEIIKKGREQFELLDEHEKNELIEKTSGLSEIDKTAVKGVEKMDKKISKNKNFK